MTVKIIIERTVKPDQQGELLLLLRELRAHAIQQPGYVTGETLTSVDRSGMHLVISTWYSLQDWRTWENNPQLIPDRAPADQPVKSGRLRGTMGLAP